jgi:D-methionine transport system ATP-binding protein
MSQSSLPNECLCTPDAQAGAGAGTVTPAGPVIELRGVSRTFRQAGGAGFDAVSQVDLSVVPGEVLGIIGRSGAGKSTLLRLINLLERPDQGVVQVAGQDLTALSSRALRQARQGIGMIFQQFNLLQNATVADNVALPLRLHGTRRRAEIDHRVAECLALVGLQDKAGAYPAQLSGGQKQRVAIARALAPHPSVLLCDEPTSALDAETTREVLSTLADVNQRLGVTIVIVTHELSVVQALCHRVAVMQAGRLVETFRTADAGQGASALARELAALAAASVGATAPTAPEVPTGAGASPLPGVPASPNAAPQSAASLSPRPAPCLGAQEPVHV